MWAQIQRYRIYNQVDKMAEFEFYFYKIKDAEGEVIYVGYTSDYHPRERRHKSKFKSKGYDWDSFTMRPIQKLICTKEDAIRREQYWIQYHHSKHMLNKIINKSVRHNRVWYPTGEELWNVINNPMEIPFKSEFSQRIGHTFHSRSKAS